MSSSEEYSSLDGSLKHQYSWDSTSSVPMWDSSDPKRAPAPLPLNPGRSSPVSSRITSPNVAAAHEAMASRARESIQNSNTSPSRSPERGLEKSLVRTAQRRMTQFDSMRPSPLSPSRDRATPFDRRTPEPSPTRKGSEPNLKDLLGDAPDLRPSRPASRAITGEPSPQSATMKALMARPTSSRGGDTDGEAPRSQNSTPKASTPATSHLSAGTPTQGPVYEGLASQILGLTSICTNLQHEMAQLTRRSKDNATDLLSLKDATSSRDEDIRKTLHTLVSGLSANHTPLTSPKPIREMRARSASPLPVNLTETNLGDSSATATLPRMPSLQAFSASLDGRTRPNLNIDGAPALALLEKIHDEMATKMDIVGLQESVNDLPQAGSAHDGSHQSPTNPVRTSQGQSDGAVAKKLEEIISLLKNGSVTTSTMSRKLDELSRAIQNGHQTNALVPSGLSRGASGASATSNSSGSNSDPFTVFRGAQDRLAQMQTTGLSTQAEFVPQNAASEEMLKILKRVHTSVFESGGLNSEIKMLLRDMRGEVLGMGRTIATKLENLENTRTVTSPEVGSTERNVSATDSGEVTEIVQDSLMQLKKHFDRLHQEYRRSSSSSHLSRSTVDVDQIENIVKGQLNELPTAIQVAIQERFEDLRGLITDTIKHNWDTFKPELSVEMDGLQRDEIIDTIKDCLRNSGRNGGTESINGATYEEVIDAVQHAMEDFKMPPPPSSELDFTKEEVLAEIKDELEVTISKCLEEFEFPTPTVDQARALGGNMDHDDLLEAVRDEVREGMTHQAKTETMLNIAEDDLVNAVRIGMQDLPIGQVNAELIDRCQNLIDEMKAEFKQYSAANGRDTEQVLDAMNDNQTRLVESFKDGMDCLRTDIESYVDRSQDVTGKDEIIEAVRGGVERVRGDVEVLISNMPQNAPALNNTGEILEGMEREFEHLRVTLTNVMRSDASSPGGREEVLDAIREGFDDLKTTLPKALPAASTESSRMSYNVEQLSEQLAEILNQTDGEITKEELDSLVREAVEQVDDSKSSDSEQVSSQAAEIIDAFNVAFDQLQDKYATASKRAQDSNNVSYDILETLKSGIANVRADIGRLTDVQKDQRATETTPRDGAVIIAAADDSAKNLEKTDITKLEVMIGQLKTQVDGIPTSSTAQEREVPSSSFGEPDLQSEIAKLQDLVLDLQLSIEGLAGKDSPSPSNIATKEDAEAIESLLMETKALIEDGRAPENKGTTAGVEKLQELLQDTRDAIDDLAIRNESEIASKQDVSAIEALAKDIHVAMEELRSKSDGAPLSKDDLGGIELLCDDMKQRLESISIDGENSPLRGEVEAVALAVKELQEKFESEAAELAQALGSRKSEHGEMTDKIEEVRAFLETVRDELKAELDNRQEELENINVSINAIGEKISGDSISTKGETVSDDLHDTLVREFERAHGDREEMKVGLEQHRDELLQRHEEHREAVIAELSLKIEDKFAELISRFEDAMLAADGKATTMEETSRQQAEAVDEAKAMAAELRLSIDALAPTITNACEDMVVDSKAAFSEIASLGNKLDDGFGLVSNEVRGEHAETRADIAKVNASLSMIQAHSEEYSPKILRAIADVLERVSQQHEETRKSAEEIKTSVNELPTSLPALPAPVTKGEGLTRDFESFDDREIQLKLDQLLDLSNKAGKTAAQNDTLEAIKLQVSNTAADLEAFIHNQQKFNERHETEAIEASESKAREIEETNNLLEKRIAQKEALEADITRLMEEKTHLVEDVEDLTHQERDLVRLKAKMQADLGGLETVLQIRREEMYTMERRAQDLHNHILNSVIDGSRAALKSVRPKSTLKETSSKRIPSNATNGTVTTKNSTEPQLNPSSAGSVLSSGVNMALKKRGSTPRSGTSTPNGGRRILSLSTIGANKAAADKAMVLNNPVLAASAKSNGMSTGLKRSHSVKSNFPTRKSSWGGMKQPGFFADSVPEEDKENSIYEEEDNDDVQSLTDTGRASSSRLTDGRSSYVSTFDGTASYVSESRTGDHHEDEEGDGQSYVSSALTTAGIQHSELDMDTLSDLTPPSAPFAGKPGVYLPTDSGIGTDCPSARLSEPSELMPRS